MKKILVSACFLGEKVRYDGKHKALSHSIIQKWQSEGRLISICPEVAGGLPVPRPAAEISNLNGKVITSQNLDVSVAFQHGADIALKICKKHDIHYALLKESSPSCGSNTVYDGSFSGKKILGEGKTTELLRQHGIKVYSELTIKDLIEVIIEKTKHD